MWGDTDMYMHSKMARKGFTLVELVVVVLILGILAAVAAPRVFDTAGNARQNGTRQSLVVVRDAIDLYKSQVGTYPPQASFATALKPYLKGNFPAVQFGAHQNAAVENSTEGTLTTPSGTGGWIYNESTGDFGINEVPYITTW